MWSLSYTPCFTTLNAASSSTHVTYNSLVCGYRFKLDGSWYLFGSSDGNIRTPGSHLALSEQVAVRYDIKGYVNYSGRSS